MKLISHRGNIAGKNVNLENSPLYIDSAIEFGYDVEIDVWYINDAIFLGHDEPQYHISIEFLKNRLSNLWIHCKNASIINYFFINKINANYFWHQEDEYTITTKGFIWTYPKEHYSSFYSNQILLDFSNMTIEKINKYECNNIYGLCCDNFCQYLC